MVREQEDRVTLWILEETMMRRMLMIVLAWWLNLKMMDSRVLDAPDL